MRKRWIAEAKRARCSSFAKVLLVEFSEEAIAHLRFQAKGELRKRMRGVRNTYPASVIREKSTAIVESLKRSALGRATGKVALFRRIEGRNEVDLSALDEHLRAAGASIYYPSIDQDTNEMTFRLAAIGELQEAGFGFEEPPTSAPEASALDWIVVPALALDPRGGRIGYGKGYYDRALRRFRPAAKDVAVCFAFQIISEVPETPGDEPVSSIVTENGFYAMQPR